VSNGACHIVLPNNEPAPVSTYRRHEIAARTIYGELPHSGTLPDDYETKALPMVNEQLERAGVRLAVVLNASLKR
jgi:hypothetical protein